MKNIKGKLKLFALTGSALMMLNGCAKEDIKETQVIESTIEESEEKSELEKELEKKGLNYKYLVFDTTYLRNNAENPDSKSRYRIIKLEKENNEIVCKDAIYSSAEVWMYTIGGYTINYDYGKSENYFAFYFQNALRPLNDVLKELGYDDIKEDYSYTDSELSSIYNNLLFDYKQSYAVEDITAIYISDDDERKYHFLVNNSDTKSDVVTYYDILDKRNTLTIDKVLDKPVIAYRFYDGENEIHDIQFVEDGIYPEVKPINELFRITGDYDGYFDYSDLVYHEGEINKEAKEKVR